MHEAMHGAQAYQRALCIVGRVHNERSARQQAKLGLVFKDCGQVRRARVDVSGGRRRCVREAARAPKRAYTAARTRPARRPRARRRSSVFNEYVQMQLGRRAAGDRTSTTKRGEARACGVRSRRSQRSIDPTSRTR